jgi:hypothetical protein
MLLVLSISMSYPTMTMRHALDASSPTFKAMIEGQVNLREYDPPPD